MREHRGKRGVQVFANPGQLSLGRRFPRTNDRVARGADSAVAVDAEAAHDGLLGWVPVSDSFNRLWTRYAYTV